nr:DNA-protecting protein DprA [Bacteroides sp.]
LIRDNKATLIQSAEDFVRAMCWDVKATPSPEAIQRTLFPDLSADECAIVSKLEEGSQQINSLVVATDIPVNRMNSLLFEMEMKGIISLQAGGIYKLLT